MPSIQRGPRKPAPRAKIRVSQGTIDKIKGMGMQAALKKASRTSNSGDFVEGVKRMYGARRLTAAKMKRADSSIEKPSLRQPKAKRPGAVTAKKGTSMAYMEMEVYCPMPFLKLLPLKAILASG